MFFISHGSTKTVDNTDYQFDAKSFQWQIVPKDPMKFEQFAKDLVSLDSEWFDNNCHPEGFLECPRCYRKHNVVDNFDILCDGCTILLKDYHSYGLSFEFTERFNQWYTNVPTDVVNARLALRMELYKVYTSEFVFHEERPLTILRDPLKNNGDLEVCYSDLDITDKKNRFILNIKEMSYGSKG